MADLVAVFSDGRIVASGDPETIFYDAFDPAWGLRRPFACAVAIELGARGFVLDSRPLDRLGAGRRDTGRRDRDRDRDYRRERRERAMSRRCRREGNRVFPQRLDRPVSGGEFQDPPPHPRDQVPLAPRPHDIEHRVVVLRGRPPPPRGRARDRSRRPGSARTSSCGASSLSFPSSSSPRSSSPLSLARGRIARPSLPSGPSCSRPPRRASSS